MYGCMDGRTVGRRMGHWKDMCMANSFTISILTLEVPHYSYPVKCLSPLGDFKFYQTEIFSSAFASEGPTQQLAALDGK